MLLGGLFPEPMVGGFECGMAIWFVVWGLSSIFKMVARIVGAPY